MYIHRMLISLECLYTDKVPQLTLSILQINIKILHFYHKWDIDTFNKLMQGYQSHFEVFEEDQAGTGFIVCSSCWFSSTNTEIINVL
jgi:hypothetical protein